MKKHIQLHPNLGSLMVTSVPSISNVMAAIKKRKIKATLSDHAALYCNNDKIIYGSLYSQIKKLVSEGGAYHDLLGTLVFPSNFRTSAPEWAIKNGQPVPPMANTVKKPDWTTSKSIANVVALSSISGMELDPAIVKNIAMGSKKARETYFSLILVAKDTLDQKDNDHAAALEELNDSMEQRMKAIAEAVLLEHKQTEFA